MTNREILDEILELWADKHNTAEIARRIKNHCKFRECDVDRIVANHMVEQDLRRKKPFRELSV